MLIGPVVAPAGTVALIDESDTILNGAIDSVKMYSCCTRKVVPEIPTSVPTGPWSGEKLAMVGNWAGFTVCPPARLPVLLLYRLSPL